MAESGDARTLREARARYFERNGLGRDGGYAARWVKLGVGPLKFGFPNTAARVRAVRLHDLHHLVTGYDTDWKGEFEISAWEIAGSCRGYVAAWLLNLGGLAAGLFRYPRAVFRAFVRGRHSSNFYRHPWSEELLDRSVGSARMQLGLAAPAPAPTLSDRAWFVAWSLVAGCYVLAVLAIPATALAGVIWLAIGL